MSERFDAIYRMNEWNGVESRSGPGSGAAATRLVIPAIEALVAELGIETVLDVGCGDGYWMPDLPGYVGFDWSREAIRRARKRHPGRTYTTSLPWSAFDLVIVRDVIQHLPRLEALTLLDGIARTGSTWLLASTYTGGENIEVAYGGAYEPDLSVPPFELGDPERLIFDGYQYHDTTEPRDPRKHLGLWRLDAV